MADIRKYSGPWNDKQLKHLLRRTLFGITLEDYRFFKGKSMSECINLLFAPPKTAPPPPIYYDDDDSHVPMGTTWVFGEENKDLNAENQRMGFIKSWWFGLMRNQKGITERMVLFWHNHFATEHSVVKDTRYTYRHLTLLRQHANGNFKKLLREITTDPQMLVYLNGNISSTPKPNENFARELQELFTVGKGPGSHYTEDDVKNAARVLTGWKDDKTKIASYFDPSVHDSGDKVFSAFYGNYRINGRNGAEGAEETFELLEMICRQQEVAKHLCRKLYRWFVGSQIDDEIEQGIITPLAGILIESDYEVKPVIEVILSSDFFYSSQASTGIIKSPVDFMVEFLRQFHVSNPYTPTDDWRIWAGASNLAGRMGQEIGSPPAVAGWPAYHLYPMYDKEWITFERLSKRLDWIRFTTGKICTDDRENNFISDLLGFVHDLANPASDKHLVEEAVDICFSAAPSEESKNYLQGLLNKGKAYKENWGELWALHAANDKKRDLTQEVNDRLGITFQIMFSMAEYQIR